jgi:hypothetical protein
MNGGLDFQNEATKTSYFMWLSRINERYRDDNSIYRKEM